MARARLTVGFDIGSTTTKAVVLDERTRAVVYSTYRRHHAYQAKSLIPILIPLFVSSFRIAQELALAMEARCYHGAAGRTRLHPLRFARRDAVAVFVLAALLAAGIIL